MRRRATDRFPVMDIPSGKRRTERDDARPARETLSPVRGDIVYEKCRPAFELHGYER
jgi:hypothetical protein